MTEQRDILLWPDGFWCFADEPVADLQKSQPFVYLVAGTPDWHAAVKNPPTIRKP